MLLHFYYPTVNLFTYHFILDSPSDLRSILNLMNGRLLDRGLVNVQKIGKRSLIHTNNVNHSKSHEFYKKIAEKIMNTHFRFSGIYFFTWTIFWKICISLDIWIEQDCRRTKAAIKSDHQFKSELASSARLNIYHPFSYKRINHRSDSIHSQHVPRLFRRLSSSRLTPLFVILI